MTALLLRPEAPTRKPRAPAVLDSTHPLASGLVGAWLFNETGGSVALDPTATPAPGTLTNTPVREVVAGELQLGFTAASNQYVLVGNPTKLQITGAMTVATHYRLRSTVSGNMALVTKDNVAGRAWTMDVASGSQGARLYISGGNGDLVTNSAVEMGNAAAAGDDRAVVGVYDPSGPQVRIYVNGTLAASSTSALSSIPVSSAGLQIARRENDGINLDGWLRYVYIWNRVLTAGQIKALTAAPYAFWRAPLVSLYPQTTGQVAVPISDVSAGAWITAPLYATLDETLPVDTDFITSSAYPASDVCEVQLAPVTDPLLSTGYVVHIRYQKPQTRSSSRVDLTVELRQGASTSIGVWTFTDITALTQIDQALTTGQADSITDHTDLRVRLTANCPTT